MEASTGIRLRSLLPTQFSEDPGLLWDDTNLSSIRRGSANRYALYPGVVIDSLQVLESLSHPGQYVGRFVHS